MRWIYISPHLDDAVLSAGGLIYEQTETGIPVEIWTVVCGFPPPGELTRYAQLLHKEWGTSSAEETVSIRREEDKNAASIVGAKTLYFDVPDCIYRRGPDGEALYMNIYSSPHQTEAALPQQIADQIAPRLEPDDVLVCPLTVGEHVDHVIVRQAMDLLDRAKLYYADIPYLLKFPGELEPKTAKMRESVHPITEAGLKSWLDAIAAYASQMSELFESGENMREEIRAYWQERQGVRLWESA